MRGKQNMNKLLIICGPTATGKTSLGISLAKKFNGEIISVDSRQVYRGMDIGTGKDIPPNSKLEILDSELGGVYRVDDIPIWGYDLADPKEEFSVSNYLTFANAAIDAIIKKGKLPILVGGTGFYIKALIDGIPTIDVPINKELRNNLLNRTADDLYELLSTVDSLKAGSMNFSDKKNPRRLIRAIEVAQYLLDHQLSIDRSIDTNKVDNLFIGLTAKKEIIEKRINKRVESRIDSGFEDEVKNLISSGVDWTDQSMMSLGYRQWRDFFEGAVPKEDVVLEWKKEERKYAGRQMVWWKKDSRINWFDVDDISYKEKVESMIEKWHNTKDAKED